MNLEETHEEKLRKFNMSYVFVPAVTMCNGLLTLFPNIDGFEVLKKTNYCQTTYFEKDLRGKGVIHSYINPIGVIS